MIPRYFRIPFDVASRDKDAFSRHTQQTFVCQRVNGVANRLPGRSILIRRLIFGGQHHTLFFSYQAPKYFSVSVALAAPFCMASSMGSPSTMPYRKPAI